MLSEAILSLDDLAGLVDGVFRQNRRGEVVRLSFYDGEGAPLDVRWAKVMTEGAGLTVDLRPRPTPEEEAMEAVRRPGRLARSVPEPLSLEALAKFAGE